MSNEPNYENYTIHDLLEARNGINSEKFPERTAEIERLISIKKQDPDVIESMEKSALKMRYQTFGPRFVAAIIDGVILVIASKLIFYITKSFGDSASIVSNTLDIFLFVIYSVVFHGMFSQTIGKMVMGVVLLDVKTEKYIGFTHALLRDSVIIACTILTYTAWLIGSDSNGLVTDQQFLDILVIIALVRFCWVLLEIITMLFNKKRRALHDFIGGTVVVRE